MSKILIWGPILLFVFYTILPKFITRLFGFALYQKVDVKQKVAFTFDDGPDPLYTPLLMDVLKKYEVKATFFVLGAKAEKHPELIARMQAEGHLIGIHNYVHYANCFMTPKQVRKQIQRSTDIVEQITGDRPSFYRPPWGIPNLFQVFQKKTYQMVMWSVMVGDWNRKVGPDILKQRLLRDLHDGAIIVLHDSGDTLGADDDAPSSMLAALEDVLIELSYIGYQCVRVDELVGKKERGGPEYDSVGKDVLSRYG